MLSRMAKSICSMAVVFGWCATADAQVRSGETQGCIAASAELNGSLWFDEGDAVGIVVQGDRSTDLDLYVSTLGMSIASDTDFTDQCLVIFVAPRSGLYDIRLKNRGSVMNCFRMVVATVD